MNTVRRVLFIAVAIVTLCCGTASAKMDWVVDILPGTVHATFAADDFFVLSGNGKETMSLITTAPHITVGGAIEQSWGYIDIKAGAGMLLNSSMGAHMFMVSAAVHKEVRPSVMIGPHAALIYYANPEWWGTTDVDFDDSTGFMLGGHIAAGDRISYLLTLDYSVVEFDVERLGAGVTTSDPVLDMSGIAVQFGVRAQF